MPTRSNAQRASIGAPPAMPPTIYDAATETSLLERAAEAHRSTESGPPGGALPPTKLSTRGDTAKVTVRLDLAFAARFRAWLAATGRTQQAAVILAVHEAMNRDGF